MIWVFTGCPALSVQKLRIIMANTWKTYWIFTIRAVAGQPSSPELCLANKIKMHLVERKNWTQTEDVLYFDFQPHPMACTMGSVVIEWKQTLFEISMLSDDWCDINISSNKKILCLWPWHQYQWKGCGHGDGTALNFRPISNIRQSIN